MSRFRGLGDELAPFVNEAFQRAATQDFRRKGVEVGERTATARGAGVDDSISRYPVYSVPPSQISAPTGRASPGSTATRCAVCRWRAAGSEAKDAGGTKRDEGRGTLVDCMAVSLEQGGCRDVCLSHSGSRSDKRAAGPRLPWICPAVTCSDVMDGPTLFMREAPLSAPKNSPPSNPRAKALVSINAAPTTRKRRCEYRPQRQCTPKTTLRPCSPASRVCRAMRTSGTWIRA